MALFNQYDNIYKVFIRPQRQQYSIHDLGPKQGQFNGFSFKRRDFSLKNKKSQKIQCSFYEPIELSQICNPDSQRPFPCVIYSHCNTGSRIEALQYVQALIGQGIGFFSMDFTGSGISDGDYVTLGWNESEDLEVVIKYLKECGKVSNLALWGRSMGGVTILLYAMRNPQISCIICDSAFISLRKLAMEVANEKTSTLIPNFVFDYMIDKVKNKILEEANFDIDSVDLTKNIENIKQIPATFICSKEDTFVDCSHTIELHKKYQGPKKLYYTEGSHSVQRNQEFVQDMIQFLKHNLFQQSNQSFQQKLRQGSPNIKQKPGQDSFSTNDASVSSEIQLQNKNNQNQNQKYKLQQKGQYKQYNENNYQSSNLQQQQQQQQYQNTNKQYNFQFSRSKSPANSFQAKNQPSSGSKQKQQQNTLNNINSNEMCKTENSEPQSHSSLIKNEKLSQTNFVSSKNTLNNTPPLSMRYNQGSYNNMDSNGSLGAQKQYQHYTQQQSKNQQQIDGELKYRTSSPYSSIIQNQPEINTNSFNTNINNNNNEIVNNIRQAKTLSELQSCQTPQTMQPIKHQQYQQVNIQKNQYKPPLPVGISNSPKKMQTYKVSNQQQQPLQVYKSEIEPSNNKQYEKVPIRNTTYQQQQQQYSINNNNNNINQNNEIRNQQNSNGMSDFNRQIHQTHIYTNTQNYSNSSQNNSVEKIQNNQIVEATIKPTIQDNKNQQQNKIRQGEINKNVVNQSNIKQNQTTQEISNDYNNDGIKNTNSNYINLNNNISISNENQNSSENIETQVCDSKQENISSLKKFQTKKFMTNYNSVNTPKNQQKLSSKSTTGLQSKKSVGNIQQSKNPNMNSEISVSPNKFQGRVSVPLVFNDNKQDKDSKFQHMSNYNQYVQSQKLQQNNNQFKQQQTQSQLSQQMSFVKNNNIPDQQKKQGQLPPTKLDVYKSELQPQDNNKSKYASTHVVNQSSNNQHKPYRVSVKLQDQNFTLSNDNKKMQQNKSTNSINNQNKTSEFELIPQYQNQTKIVNINLDISNGQLDQYQQQQQQQQQNNNQYQIKNKDNIINMDTQHTYNITQNENNTQQTMNTSNNSNYKIQKDYYEKVKTNDYQSNSKLNTPEFQRKQQFFDIQNNSNKNQNNQKKEENQMSFRENNFQDQQKQYQLLQQGINNKQAVINSNQHYNNRNNAMTVSPIKRDYFSNSTNTNNNTPITPVTNQIVSQNQQINQQVNNTMNISYTRKSQNPQVQSIQVEQSQRLNKSMTPTYQQKQNDNTNNQNTGPGSAETTYRQKNGVENKQSIFYKASQQQQQQQQQQQSSQSQKFSTKGIMKSFVEAKN